MEIYHIQQKLHSIFFKHLCVWGFGKCLPQVPFRKNLNHFRLRWKFSSLSRNMAELLRNGDAEDVAVNLGAFEQQALIHDFSTSASARFNATLNSLSKWLVAAVFVIIFLWRHDTEALWAASGSILNARLSIVLKRILNQERPVSAIRSDPGMPSAHAQSIFYTVMFCIVSMVEYFGLNGVTAVISALIFAIGSYLSWLRVSQQLHTTSQVSIGAALGFSFSVFWFWLWDAIVLDAFISHLWIRILVVLGTVAICVSFLLYMFRYWVLEKD